MAALGVVGREPVHRQRAAHRALRVVGLRDRRGEQHGDGVADDAVERPVVLERDADHPLEIVVDDLGELLGILDAFDQRGETRDVGEHERALATLAAEPQVVGVLDQVLDEVRRQVVREHAADPLPFALRRELARHGVCDERRQEHGAREQRVREQEPRVPPVNRRAGDDENAAAGGERRREHAPVPPEGEHQQPREHHDQRFESLHPQRSRREHAEHGLLGQLRVDLDSGDDLPERSEPQILEAGRRRAEEHDGVLRDQAFALAFHDLPGGDVPFRDRFGQVDEGASERIGGDLEAARADDLQRGRPRPSRVLGDQGVVRRGARHAQRLGDEPRVDLAVAFDEQRDAAHHAVAVGSEIDGAVAGRCVLQRGQRHDGPVVAADDDLLLRAETHVPSFLDRHRAARLVGQREGGDDVAATELLGERLVVVRQAGKRGRDVGLLAPLGSEPRR